MPEVPQSACVCCKDDVEIPEESSEHTARQNIQSASGSSRIHEILSRKLSPASVFVNDEENLSVKRKWVFKLEFLLSCMGYSVGLGNIWRFPYLAYKNGGGSFLVAYFIMMILVGGPLLFLEMAIGQFSGKGALAVWQICPIFQGIGYAMVILSATVAVCFAVVVGWALLCLLDSFRIEVNYKFCENDWNTGRCFSRSHPTECQMMNSSLNAYNTSCFHMFNNTMEPDGHARKVLPSEEYFKYNVVGISESISDFGELRWENTLCLAAAWFLVVICLFKSIRTSGKIVYFTATFPYIVMIIFLVRAISLTGSRQGLRFFLLPEMKRLADPTVWLDAGGQAFFSLGAAFGSLITLTAYNKFDNNCLKDAAMIFAIDAGTCLLSGCVTFAILGVTSVDSGEPMREVIRAGSGLIFVSYPEAIVRMPWSPLWSVMGFLMIVVTGVESVVSIVETNTAALIEHLEPLKPYRREILLGSCLALFIISLPLTSNAGLYWFTVLNDYSITCTVMVIGLLEAIAVVTVYGVNRFCEDIEMMIGCEPWRRLMPFYKVCWMGIVPGLVTGTLVFYWISYTRASVQPTFPLWAEILGWFLALFIISIAPIFALVRLIRSPNKVSIFENLRSLCWPTDAWGPKGRSEAENI